MAKQKRPYKRSWKNLLLIKGVQLWLTLSMSFLCAAVIAGLGLWVLSEARVATKVGVTNILGAPCPKPDMAPLFAAGEVPAGDPAAAQPVAPEPESEPAGESEPGGESAPGGESDAPAGDTAAAPVPEPVITIDDSSFSAVPALPPGFVEDIVRYRTCRLELSAKIASLHRGQRLIGWFLVAVGILLTLGITFAGIKMSHRIAGPLYKVTLYLNKVKAGTYDTVYNLRKGDQLVAFYDRFKAAHAGIRAMEQDDLDRYKEIIAAAEAENLADKSPELAAALEDLKAACARKEKSLDGK